ncbi:hypothetical protein P175DRAFT_0203917 [Aspergillus ochraceoroseus IBT 24754]|uniref:Uncharacterized protein n=1 Tax=Aspergillus ochraceoroseus IBT 24754 TaxID=1392256 RepID=A0A2T5M031_9EURO|nr:uncharacterized protein P175DRAFT_0203917 [Aspergillus ochraceoroseus IBT 24754]PTU21883.1 hypothetical protein P175DRAFT_0203917 [Aspergillus ochraceoroseus IBT 24754]
MATTCDKFPLLCWEVERLVTAPYAPSLQDLYDLAQEVSSDGICSWAVYKRCQVGALVDVLVDGLSRSHWALRLITSFARASCFRDSLLERYPYLLDQFLQRSIEGGEPEYSSVCISLLSTPLPSGFIPPARIAPFIMNLIDRMRDNPCVETVRSLYLISSFLQASPRIILEISEEIMSCFQTELTKTLRNLEDHMGNLLCLATFAKLASAPIPNITSENETEASNWWQNIKHFFGMKRGLKTLDLVFLRVILACSSNRGNLTAGDSVESIRLAIEICNVVNQEQRNSWIAGNSLKIAKLCEKITREGVDPSVRMLGITFLVSLIPPSSLPPDLVRLGLDWLLSEDSRVVLETLPRDPATRLVEANIICSGQYAVKKVLNYIFTTLSTKPSVNIANLQMARLLLLGLRSFDSHQFPSGITDIVSNQYRDTINRLADTFPRRPSLLKCDGSNNCYASISRLENELLFDLLTFCLQASMASNIECSQSTEVMVLMNFMTKTKQLLPEFKCIFSESRPLDFRASFSSLKIRETAQFARSDWRTGIRETMIASTRILNDDIVQKVEDICYELEQRCGNIEEPLRVAAEERNKYFLETEQLKQNNNDLKTRLNEESNTVAELREEFSRLESHADAATERAEELLSSLTQTRQELEDLKRSSREIIVNERELARTKELDLIASITQKDDQLEGLQEDIKREKEENERAIAIIASISDGRDTSLETIASLNCQVSTLRTELENSETLLSEKREQLERLFAEKNTAAELAENLRMKLDGKESEFENLRAALRDTTESFKEELETLRQQSDLRHSNMAQECNKHKENILSLQHEMHEATLNSTRELQTKEKRIQHLDKKVQHLREERAAKAREFSEAQQHIGRLMSVMGFKQTAYDSRTTGTPRPRSSFDLSQVAAMQTQTNSGEDIPQGKDEEALASPLDSNMSQTSARSPKRSRNSAFPLVDPSPPHSSSHGTSKKPRDLAGLSNSKTPRERRPLKEVDYNSQPSSQGSDSSVLSQSRTVQDNQFNKQTDRHQLEDIDLDLDLEFSKDFVFTSTALSEFNKPSHS